MSSFGQRNLLLCEHFDLVSNNVYASNKTIQNIKIIQLSILYIKLSEENILKCNSGTLAEKGMTTSP